MATFYGIYQGNGVTKWYIEDLQYAANQYSSFKVTTSDGKSITWSSSYTGNTTNNTTSDHNCGTSITGSGYATYSGTEYALGSSTVNSEACPISPFSWTYPKTSTGDFNLTASEWNDFTSRINEFRQYKGLSNYSFTRAYSGYDFTASMFNQAVTAINGMNPPTSPPSTKSSGQDIYASYLNGLRDSLNSIT